MTEYRVLWVDDEYEEKGGGFIALADDFNIKIDAVKSLDEFKVKLNAGYEEYDGIITDARFFKTATQVTGTENEDAIYELNEFILESIPKKFKLFVYTGQPDLFGGAQFNKMFKDVYEKSKDEERLFLDLKIAADKLPEMQIKKKYSRVFEIFNDHYLPKSSIKDLLKFLDDELDHDKSSIKMARDFIEDLFRSFAKHEIIPSYFVDRSVKSNAIARLISGSSEDNYKLDESSLPPKIITDLISYLVRTTNPACHRAHIDDHINNVATDYLFNSVKYALLDVIIWFKLYIDNEQITNNWSNLKSIIACENDYVKGDIIQLNSIKFFAFLRPHDKSINNIFIPRSVVEEYELQEGQIVECIVEEYDDRKLGKSNKVTSIKQ